MARVKTTSHRRPSDGGRSDGGRSVCGPSDGGRGSKGDESVGKDVPNREGRDKGPLRTCNSQSIGEAEEEYNPHKRCRVSESTPSKPAGYVFFPCSLYFIINYFFVKGVTILTCCSYLTDL
ncbi:uncharacterized protein LOC125493607 isoform X4 [Beta vulgaris subsp. vulgaris]|uniref:uncharacterized protein LOC125493607 isoform X4 n=1 Tax=Beta vulgaris subsp. vulgaris TaxID=3555 RepID=UPI00203718F9|nr:uncharacterized protein LOC125493607 isoform X4 [Beta vulgaris subsp. vulgaris]